MRERLAAAGAVAREALREDNGADVWSAERVLALRAALMRVAALAGDPEALGTPWRRPSEVVRVEWRGQVFDVVAGFRPRSGAVIDVAAQGWREGTDLQFLVDDVCCLISAGLQRGLSVADLRRLTGTAPDPAAGGEERPVSVIGAILRAVEELEAGT